MLGGSRNKRRIAELRQMRQPLAEQHRALSYEKSQLSSDLWGVKLYADRQRQDTMALSRRVELLEALTDRDTAMAERQDRINAGYRGLSDAEREQAAPVFAELEDAGVWIDFAAQRKGRVSSPTAPPSAADVYAGTAYGQSAGAGVFAHSIEEQLGAVANRGGTETNSPASGVGHDSGLEQGTDDDLGL